MMIRWTGLSSQYCRGTHDGLRTFLWTGEESLIGSVPPVRNARAEHRDVRQALHLLKHHEYEFDWEYSARLAIHTNPCTREGSQVEKGARISFPFGW